MEIVDNNTKEWMRLSRDEYDFLSASHLYYSLILDAIFKDASLSWDKESLSFGTEHVSRIVECIAKERYLRVLMKLKTDDEIKQKEDKNGTDQD